MTTDTGKAALISAKDLPKIVDQAIHAAGNRAGVTGPLVVRWDIAGKVVRDMATAHDFSEAVAKHVGGAGHAVAPAVLAIDGRILAGFVERVAMPQLREF